MPKKINDNKKKLGGGELKSLQIMLQYQSVNNKKGNLSKAKLNAKISLGEI